MCCILLLVSFYHTNLTILQNYFTDFNNIIAVALFEANGT
jgi:hypothetical protein